MLATPRRLLLALVALAACTPVLADVFCTPNGDGSWTCSGYGGGGSYPPGTVVTNVVGVCTNCVAMSPSECEKIKGDIQDTLSHLQSYELDIHINFAKSYVDDIFESGLIDYLSSYDVSAVRYLASNLNKTREELDYILSDWNSVSTDISLLSTIPDRINCSSCTASFGGSPTNSVGGGSSSCPDCPCKEQMEALHDLLKDDFLPRIKKIDTNVAQLTNLITIARDQLRTTKEGFHNVTNLFNRLDDYVLDDFSNRVYQIRYDVNFIASNLAQKVQRIFIDQSYSNAQFYVRQDSDMPIEMADLDETLIPEGDVSKFDWGEFENLPWFTRVEYLLLKLNGVYVTTNNNANAGVSAAEKNQQDIEDGFSDFKSSVNGEIKTGFERVGTSITSFFNSFNSAVSTQGDKVVEIHLMSNFIGNEPLMLNIDPDVADACRTISSLLWTVLFGFLLYKIMIYFWVVFVDTINWWVNQTQGFVK